MATGRFTTRCATASLLILSVASCSAPAPEAAPPNRPEVATTTSPQSTNDWPPSYVWMAGATDNGDWLHFGPDESDNHPIQFDCASGALSIWAIVKTPDPSKLPLGSGEIREDFAARGVDGGEIFDGVFPEATVPVSSPVLVEFRKTGALSAGEPLVAFRSANAQELKVIDQFFEACAKS